jgi:hypothetical protein
LVEEGYDLLEALGEHEVGFDQDKGLNLGSRTWVTQAPPF